MSAHMPMRKTADIVRARRHWHRQLWLRGKVLCVVIVSMSPAATRARMQARRISSSRLCPGKRVGAESDVDTRAQVGADVLHRLPVARKRERTMRDRNSGFGQQSEISGRCPAEPRVLIDEDRVAKNGVRIEQIVRGGVLQRRLPVAACDSLNLTTLSAQWIVASASCPWREPGHR